MSAPHFIGSCTTDGVGRNVWRVTRPFAFVDSQGLRLDIEAGMLTDYTSAPRPVWAIVPPADGQTDAAAVVHDWAVRYRNVLGISLWRCHQIYWDALTASNVTGMDRARRVGAVRAFNWMDPGRGDGTVRQELLDRVDPRLVLAMSTPYEPPQEHTA